MQKLKKICHLFCFLGIIFWKIEKEFLGMMFLGKKRSYCTEFYFVKILGWLGGGGNKKNSYFENYLFAAFNDLHCLRVKNSLLFFFLCECWGLLDWSRTFGVKNRLIFVLMLVKEGVNFTFKTDKRICYKIVFF